MAPSAFNDTGSEGEWMTQFKAMRDAVDELKLPHTNGDIPPYGQDIDVDCQRSSSSASNSDFWDLLSVGEDEELSVNDPDVEFVTDTSAILNGNPHDAQWLAQICVDEADSQSGLGSIELYQQLTALLTSDVSG